MAMPKRTYNKADLYRWWHAGVEWTELARRLRCSVGTVRRMVHDEKLPPRKKQKTAPAAPDPTPSEIAERAAECRERHFAEKRAEQWEPPA